MRLFVFIFCLFCLLTVSFASEPETPLNLVFCPLSYQKKETFLKDVDAIAQRLSKTRPFNEKELIRLWYFFIPAAEAAAVFQPASGMPPLKVQSALLNRISASLKANYKLVIIDASGSLSCAELSSKDKFSLLILGRKRYKGKDSFTKGFLHELGHSLGLRDETVSSGASCPAGPPNCALTKEQAEEWWGGLIGQDPQIGYISGCCGNKNYIRPTVISLMNDPETAEDFGPVNERYLRGCF